MYTLIAQSQVGTPANIIDKFISILTAAQTSTSSSIVLL